MTLKINSDDDWRALHEMYLEEQMSLADVAFMVKKNVATVRRAWTRLSLLPASSVRRSSIKDDEWREMHVKFLKSGLSYTQFANRHNIARTWMVENFRRLDLEPPAGNPIIKRKVMT